jgi:hypothetical protein
MKRAVALLRKGNVFIDWYSKTTAGVWVGSGPVFVVVETDFQMLTARIREALNASTEGIRHPSQDEWNAIQAPMLNAAGVKSWKTLAKGSRAVGLECEGTLVKIVSSRSYEHKGGEPLPEKTIECDLNSPDLGSALMKAFDASS